MRAHGPRTGRESEQSRVAAHGAEVLASGCKPRTGCNIELLSSLLHHFFRTTFAALRCPRLRGLPLQPRTAGDGSHAKYRVEAAEGERSTVPVRGCPLTLLHSLPSPPRPPPNPALLERAATLYKWARDAGLTAYSRDEVVEQLAAGEAAELTAGVAGGLGLSGLAPPLRALWEARSAVQAEAAALTARVVADDAEGVAALLKEQPGGLRFNCGDTVACCKAGSRGGRSTWHVQREAGWVGYVRNARRLGAQLGQVLFVESREPGCKVQGIWPG